MPETTQNDEPRIGVYVCYCGGNISDVVDCEKVAAVLRNLPNVVVTRTNMSMCSDAGQALIRYQRARHESRGGWCMRTGAPRAYFPRDGRPCRVEPLSLSPCWPA